VEAHAAAADSDDSDDDDDSPAAEFQGRRRTDRGYTPFEFIDFTERPLRHEVSVWVDRPVADVYAVWANRLNWMQWFDMIDEVGFHEEEPAYMSMYLWYRWGEWAGQPKRAPRFGLARRVRCGGLWAGLRAAGVLATPSKRQPC
jgi:hypothetical protein